MEKDQIRIKMKEERSKLSLMERTKQGQHLLQLLMCSKAYQDCEALFSFVSFGTEVDTHAIIEQAFRDRKKVYVPRVEPHGLEFYQIQSLEHLIPSKFGVPEPEAEEARRYQTKQESPASNYFRQAALIYKNVMLLPGLAFDPQGNRIGYGAGYYDKYLSCFREEHFYKIALAYDFQVLDQIEAKVYDQRADLILTPRRVIDCRKKGGSKV